MGHKGTKVLTCGGVVGADKPLQMGWSMQKSSHSLADCSEWGLGQCPKVLKKICDLHHFSVIFPTQDKDHDWQEQPGLNNKVCKAYSQVNAFCMLH